MDATVKMTQISQYPAIVRYDDISVPNGELRRSPSPDAYQELPHQRLQNKNQSREFDMDRFSQGMSGGNGLVGLGGPPNNNNNDSRRNLIQYDITDELEKEKFKR